VKGTARIDPEARRAPEHDPTCFVLGGVAFEICPAPGLDWSVGEEHRLFVGPYSISPVAGEVRCVVSPAPELERDCDRAIRWEWDGELAHVETGRVRAELRRLSAGHYAATAMVVPNEAGCSSLVTALSAAIASREGGLVLHAAGVEIDGRAVLFLGPSGAGKTTAANHSLGARWIARDRAAIYPTPLGWYAAGMPGGDPIELVRAPGRVFPLAGLYRIRKANAAELTPLAGAPAVRHLRESLQSASGNVRDEHELLDRAHRVTKEVRIGELRTALGIDHTALLRTRR
jgi:hypothetical protein